MSAYCSPIPGTPATSGAACRRSLKEAARVWRIGDFAGRLHNACIANATRGVSMGRKAKAVICRQLNGPVVVEQIEVESPQRDEVMIKLGACGVCHSDLSAINGTIGMPLPLILGHEGAGTVVEAGEGVIDFA